MYFKTWEDQIFENYKKVKGKKTLTANVTSPLMEDTIETTKKQDDAMDEKTFEQFHLRISRCKHFLDEYHPWFGIFLSKLKTVPTYDLETMGVDDFGNIYINPKFALEKTEKETIGVLAHEVMHVITLTFFRKNSRDHRLWNIATDFIMNKMLLESGFSLPADGCLPVQKGDKWIVELKDQTTGKLYGEIDVTNMHEEKFYDEMVKMLEENEKEKNKQGKPDQQNGPKVYQPGDRVKSRVTGLKGTVTAVKGLQPGKQDLSIKWD